MRMAMTTRRAPRTRSRRLLAAAGVVLLVAAFAGPAGQVLGERASGTSGRAADPADAQAPRARHAPAARPEVFSPDGGIVRLDGSRALAPPVGGLGGLPATVTRLHGTAPAGAGRLDIVFVGDGYTDLERYAAHVDRIWQGLVATAPFDRYAPLLTAWRVDVRSPVSGVSNDPSPGRFKPTPLGMRFWCQGIPRLLCADEKALAAYRAAAPDADLVIAVANSDTYGGSGSGSGIAAVAGGHPLAAQIVPHELGHALGGLPDDYGPEAPGARGGGESAMRTLGHPFTPADTETLVRKLYEHARLIESTSPQGEVTGRQVLSATTALPPDRLDVTWSVDGYLVPGLAGHTSADTAELPLNPGQWQRVAVEVRDPTPLVRDEEFRRTTMTAAAWWWVRG